MTVIPFRNDGSLIGDPLMRLANIDAEQALLGALFLDNRAYEAVVDLIDPADFSHPLNGEIFQAIGRAIESGRQATPPTIKDQFPTHHPYLVQLGRSAITLINAPDYARVISDLARRREIILAARQAEAEAASIEAAQDAAVVLDEIEERFFHLAEKRLPHDGGPRLVRESVGAVLASIEAAYKAGAPRTLQSGLVDLDRLTGGMAPGELVVLAGRPAMGKSALAGSIAWNAARTGKRVLYFSLEMTRAELAGRWVAGLTGISTDRQRKGEVAADEWAGIFEAAERVKEQPIVVDDQPRLAVAQMRQRARRVKRRHGLDLVIVDHLQLIRLGGKQESRRVEVGEASGMLKALAKELGVPILLLSQLNRAVEGRDNKRPTLSDLKESGDIEQDADQVMFLYREEYYLARQKPRRRDGEKGDSFIAREQEWATQLEAARGIAEIDLAKNRHGPTGGVKAHFDGLRQRFDNLFRD